MNKSVSGGPGRSHFALLVWRNSRLAGSGQLGQLGL